MIWQGMARLLHQLFHAEPVELFHRINIHSALSPDRIMQILQPIFKKGEIIKAAYGSVLRTKAQTVLRRAPYVTVSD